MNPKKIKVIFGVNDFLIGGMQRQFIEQLKQFDRTRFDISLVTLFSFPREPDLYAELPPDLTVTRFSFRGLTDLKSWRALYRFLVAEKPDIVVSSLFTANTVFRVLQPFLGYASIAREHNTYVDKPLWQRFVDRILASRSYKIVAVSRGVAEFTAKQEGLSPAKFVVIRNGIAVADFQKKLSALPERAAVRAELGLPVDAAPLILTVARFQHQKNHALLLNGFAEFHATAPRAHLVLLGYGPLLPALQAQVQKLGLAEAVTVSGTQSNVTRFYKAADLYASTSTIEGLSNSYLEALAAGIPLAVTRTAGTDELLQEGQNGYFIPEASAEAVAATLTRANELVQGAVVTKTVEAFDVAETVHAYEHLFEEATTAR